jgi:8-hydroxy-5-deazaflavin:NADPH oxidoreductase
MSTIGIIGSGHVGSNLAKAAIGHGYDVVLSGSGTPDVLLALADELGPKARAATAGEAAQAGDLVIVATPITAVESIPVEPLRGKVVIATINYFPQRDGHIAEIDNGTITVPESCSGTCRAARSCGRSACSTPRACPVTGTRRATRSGGRSRSPGTTPRPNNW